MEQWKKIFAFTIIISYFYILMEWLFFVTKPSFLIGIGGFENLLIILFSGGLLAFITIIPLIILIILNFFFVPQQKLIFLYIATCIPAFLAGALFLILLDNFTYTVFKFGIVTTTEYWRGIYVFLFLYLVKNSYHWLKQTYQSPVKPNFILYLPWVLMLISSFIVIEQLRLGRTAGEETISLSAESPNILLIGSDGVTSENMSIYGYHRKTTPFLETIVPSSIFAENAFANWNSSAASTTSLLTGKTPLETHVFNGENILTGINAYQHLPGILQKHGYYTVQMGLFPYVDAYAMNFQEGFDVVNGRTTNQFHIFQIGKNSNQGQMTYLLIRIFERISERLMHIFYYRTMNNPINQVYDGVQATINDEEKVNEILNILKNNDKPVFIHAHLMGTHGPLFFPTENTFSKGQKQSQEWMTDFYDDSILTFDSQIKKIYNELAKSKELDNTIIIIYSDHGMAYQIQRVPFIIRFPDKEFARTIKSNVQNLDIAPTLLGYLKIPIPDWMQGQSLLRGEPSSNRLVSIGEFLETRRVIHCEIIYQFMPEAQVWLLSTIQGHTMPCHKSSTEKVIPTSVRDSFSTIIPPNTNLEEHATININNSYFISRRDAALLVSLYMGIEENTLPPAQGIFADMPVAGKDTVLVEYLFQQDVLNACVTLPSSFCPQSLVMRQEAASILLKSSLGKHYTPPPAIGIFLDVPIQSPFAPWIEDLYNRGITSGCSQSPLQYCPESFMLTEHFKSLLDNTFFLNKK